MRSNAKKTYYFGAGPAVLPQEVLTRAQAEIYDYCGTGLSILEISHRSEAFSELIENAESLLRELMSVPDDYAVLFMHGGASTQFSILPLNLLDTHDIADYVCTGHWSSKAAKEANKFANINTIQALQEDQKISIKPIEQWTLSTSASYLHYCDNETINGIAFQKSIQLKNKKIACDMTSSILTRNIEVKDFDLIYASAQKNLGIAGLCVVIINKALLDKVNENVPKVFDYKSSFENRSLVNTPPIFAIYILYLVLNWLKGKGGVNEIDKIRKVFANEIYKLIDNNELYVNNVDKNIRSNINIPFFIENENLKESFLQQAEENNLLGLRGHKSVGGMRISLYNAIQQQGVKKLIEFLEEFVSTRRV